MRILDNLISDYTTRTHDQIKQQLRSGPPSRGHNSRLQHSHNEIEDIPSMRGSVSGNSQSNQHAKQYQKTLDGLTGQSLQMPGSLSSVQDVSETNKLADEELSSQLLSTARDRQLQAEVAAAQKQKETTQKVVPQLQMGTVSTLQKNQGANSERLMKPSCYSTMTVQEPIQTEENVLNLSNGNGRDYGTPQKVYIQNQDTVPMMKQPEDFNANSKHIIVEEQKFTQSRQGSACDKRSQVQAKYTPQISQSSSEEVSESNRNLQEWHKQQQQNQNLAPEEEEKEVNTRHVLSSDMEGDMQEKSIEMIPDSRRGHLPSPQIRQTSTETKPNKKDQELMYNRNQAITVQRTQGQNTDQTETETSKFDDNEEPIDFALSAQSPYLVHSRGAQNEQLSNHDTNSMSGGMAYNFGFNSMQSSHLGIRSQSLRQKPGPFDKGPVSSRMMTKHNSQMPTYYNAASTVKQETTDSDFFNLTDEGESQMDPILVMRNLSNTQLCSATTSMIQIQENQDQQMKQSFQNFLNNERPQGKGGANNECQAQAYQILDIEQIPSNSGSIDKDNNSRGIMTYEPVVVQTISNSRLTDLKSVQELPPELQKHELQRSFEQHRGSKEKISVESKTTPMTIDERQGRYQNVRSPSVLLTVDSVASPEMELYGGAPDKETGYEIPAMVEDKPTPTNGQGLTKGQARRSSMVFIEERQPSKQNSQVSHLLEPINPKNSTAVPQTQVESSSHESTGKVIVNQTYTRGKKPGSDLPPNLQRLGNEIIHQLLLDEVIHALDDVIQMSGDKLTDIILDQQNVITISNRNLIKQSRTAKRRVATNEDGVMLDNSDRYELSDADSLTIQIDQSQEQPVEDSLEENPSVPAQASQGGQEPAEVDIDPIQDFDEEEEGDQLEYDE